MQVNNKNSGRKHSILLDIMLLSVAAVWGLGFPITQMVLDSPVSPGLMIAWRFTIAAAVFAAVFFKDIRTTTLAELRYALPAGCLLSAAFIVQTIGLSLTTPSNNAFLTSTGVVMVPLLGWLFFKQRAGLRLVLLACGSFIGASVLSINFSGGFSMGAGDLLTLLCALMYSVHTVYLGTIAEHIGTNKLAFWQLFVAAVVSSVYVLLCERDTFFETNFSGAFVPVLYLALMGSAYAFWAQTFAQARVSPTRATILLSCEGVLGSTFSVLLGYEPLTLKLLVGGGIIFTCIMLLQVPQRAGGSGLHEQTQPVLRAWAFSDNPAIMQLFHNTVHTCCATDYTPAQLDAWAPTVLPERWCERFGHDFTLVAEHAGEVVGFASLKACGELDMLFVHHNHTRKGIATALAAALEAEAAAQGIEKITTYASKTARPFFERRGYEVLRENTMERHGVALTNYFMHKEL